MQFTSVIESRLSYYDVYGYGLDADSSLTYSIFLGIYGFLSSIVSNLYIYIPLLTMGLLSRETSSGSIKLLYSSPVSSVQIVAGKYLAAITFAAEIIKYLLPLPIPVSIYGLVLLFLLLKTGLLPLEKIQDVGNLLLELMPLLLVPASVSFVTALDAIQAMLLPVLIMGLAGTLLVMALTGLVSQAVIRRRKGAASRD